MENYQRQQSPDYYPPATTPDRLPMFVLVVMIVDLCLLGIRLLSLPLSIFGATQIDSTHPLYYTVAAEIASGAFLVIVGITANILVLRKKSFAVPVAWGAVLATLLSMGVGIVQASISLSQFDSTEEIVGGIIGGAIVMMIRVAILGFYIAAILKFKRWLGQRGAAPSAPTPATPLPPEQVTAQPQAESPPSPPPPPEQV